MAKLTNETPSGRHRDLWRVEANRWIYSKFGSRYEQLLALKHDPVTGVEQGEELEAAEVPDRATAIALAHQFLDKHAEEAAGRAGLEIHIRPPQAQLFDPKVYEVPAETMAQARRLDLKGDVAAQIRRMGLCSLMAGQAPSISFVATKGCSCRIMVLSEVGMKPPHDGVGSVGLVMSGTRSSNLEDPSRNKPRAMASASSRQGQLSARWRISSSFYLWFMPLAPAWLTNGTRCRRAAGDGG